MVETIYLPIAVLITTLYFLLPAYLSNSSGLIFGGGVPVDFGKTDKNTHNTKKATIIPRFSLKYILKMVLD